MFPINVGIIIIIAILLITPQVIMKTMIIGSDSVFHFNRFYDTASQIRNGNFQYFIHMYGFQQSGRIVNALYGPMMAYFQGLLVLISPSWFAYQVLSNFILYLVAGLSMYLFLRISSIKKEISLFSSILFMTTFSIQYWIIRQGFSSWGAAFFPLCLLPIIQFKKINTFNFLEVGFFVALMTQIHLFTAVFVVIIYFAYFIVLFFKKNINNKMKLLFSLFCAVLFYLLLTLNIWYSILTIHEGNTLNPPFINKTIYLNTITAHSYYWLFNPFPLFLIIVLKIYYDNKMWKSYDVFDKATSFLILLFLLLTTNAVPWNFLSTNHLLGVDFIQFPFRFFVPFTVLLLLSFAKSLNTSFLSSEKKNWLKSILVLSLIQVLLMTIFVSLRWKSNEPILASKHQFLFADSSDLLKQSFFNRDKSLSLELVQKSTPDYLPIYFQDDSNKYVEYEKYILDENKKYKKNIEKNSLIISWEGESLEERNIPIIVYQNTNVFYNSKKLTANDMQLTSIGTPIVKDEKGRNIMTISYGKTKYFSSILLITVITWVSYAFYKMLNLVKKY